MTKSGRSIRRSFARVPISTLLKPVTNEAAYLSNEVARLRKRGPIPLVSIESGNSPQMIKSNYWDLKRPDEGFKWFGITLPIAAERRQEPFLMHLPLTSFGH